MINITRRDTLKIGAGAAAGATLFGTGALGAEAKWESKPEKGASLRVLRPAKFVQGDETLWLENTKKFEAQTGVKVRVDSEGWEDLRPKSAVAANVGKGPDIVYGWYDDAHQYPEKLVDVTDVATYLGNKYGGWFDVCKKYGMRRNRWISVPLGAPGSKINYRISWVKEAGFDSVPRDLPGFLKLCQALKAKGHPAGFALGNAVGDANGWCHWLVWSHGGKMVDDKDNVVINSPQTVAALEYVKELYATFIPGTLSWLDPSNNKAFLDGQVGLTGNGISIYYAAKTSQDPAIRRIADDMDHAQYPIGPVGRPTEVNLVVPAMIFKYSKFPNAAKDYIRFMMEEEQYAPWATASIGYFSHPLAAYDKLPIWTADPKHTPYRDTMRTMQWTSYSGSLGYASAGVLADFVMVNMVASVCSGSKSPKDAAAEAQKRAERYYKV
ncbi:MAG: carbohydrate ABC transporter substrate-binding protein [Alphaproteobacteria bacterium]|nr:carbohydrate ABC transporter substrate-binding protein [Alphaproteobacteria bacterium]